MTARLRCAAPGSTRRRSGTAWPIRDPLNISDARDQLAAIVDRARSEHRPVWLARRGRRVAAVVDADDIDRPLELAGDMADIRAAEEARREMGETGETPIPWDEVKADLGLT